MKPQETWIEAVLRLAASNWFASTVVIILGGLYLIGRVDAALPPAKHDPTLEELREAILALKAKKKSSPAAREVVEILKECISILEEDKQDEAA